VDPGGHARRVRWGTAARARPPHPARRHCRCCDHGDGHRPSSLAQSVRQR
jgi:hypothetical protein